MKGKNVLSLFNGMGCIWIAMEMAGHKVNKRYSSEIEKFPNQANNAMFPNTEQIGDVRLVDVSKLEPIDLLAGGSPCQSFSFAGKRKGMVAKEAFVPPTEEEYRKFLEISDSDIDFEDYVEHKRIAYNKENTELIEILTLEHYLQLKKEEFEFEGQSYLFWEYIRILTDIKKYNPDVKFLLENVPMGKKWQKIITQAIGINPIKINAALVSAQNRDRLFWTNIFTTQDGFFGDLKCAIPQPKDQGILLKDILEKPEDFESLEAYNAYMKKYFLSEKMMKYLNSRKANFNAGKINYKTGLDIASCLNASTGLDISDNIIVDTNCKARCFTAGGNSGGLHSQMDLVVHNTMPRSSKTKKGGTGHLSRTDGKTYCLDTGNTNAIEICVAMRGRNPDNPKSRKAGLPTEQQLEARSDGKTNCLTGVQKDNLIFKKNYVQWDISGKGYQSQQDRAHYENGKAGCIPSSRTENKVNVLLENNIIRRLTPRECGRLQSVPEDKLDIILNAGISDTQLYKMFGNGWNCKVIEWILSHLNL